MNKFFYIIPVMLLTNCANENTASKIDTQLEVKDKVDGAKIGLNDDDEVVMQTETDAAEELRAQRWANARLEDDLQNIYIDLKQCREDLADPRLGGDGSLKEIPEIDNLKPISEVKESFGITEEGNLKFVKKEYFMEALKNERKYEQTLRSTIKVVTTHNDTCQRRMGAARQKAGLPTKRYEAKGYFTEDGTWISTSKAEKNVDDAFERAAKAQEKSKEKQSE